MATEPGEYRVAVSVANPDHVEQLMRTALDLARERGGDVFVVSVVASPPDSPFSVFRDDVIVEEFAGDRRDVLDRALEAAEDADVAVDGRLIVADDVAGGIVAAATECDADAVVLGWHARPHREVLMGHIVDDVVAAAPCDVLVEKIGPTANGVGSILLPAGVGDHTDLAAEVSRAVARANDARVDVVRVVAPDASGAERERASDLASEVAAYVDDVPTRTEVIEGTDVVGTLVEAAEARDLTVVGGGQGGWIRRVVVGSTARDLGRRAETTVVVATRARGTRSWLARAFA